MEDFIHLVFLILITGLILGLFKPHISLKFLPEEKRQVNNVYKIYISAFLVLIVFTAIFSSFLLALNLFITAFVFIFTVALIKPRKVLTMMHEEKRTRKWALVYFGIPLIVFGIIMDSLAPGSGMDPAYAEEVTEQTSDLTDEELAEREKRIKEIKVEAQKEHDKDLKEEIEIQESLQEDLIESEQIQSDLRESLEEEREMREKISTELEQMKQEVNDIEADTDSEKEVLREESEELISVIDDFESQIEDLNNHIKEVENENKELVKNLNKANEEKLAYQEKADKLEGNTEITNESDDEVIDNTSEENLYYLNDRVKVGELEYIIHDYWYTSYFDDGFYSLSTNGYFLVMNVTVLNDDDGPRMIDDFMFTMYDSSGKTYNPNYDADTFVNNNPLELFLNEINPGISLNTNIVFEVPQNVSDLRLEVASGVGWTWSGHDYEEIWIGDLN